jgi:hypothetical protein
MCSTTAATFSNFNIFATRFLLRLEYKISEILSVSDPYIDQVVKEKLQVEK